MKTRIALALALAALGCGSDTRPAGSDGVAPANDQATTESLLGSVTSAGGQPTAQRVAGAPSAGVLAANRFTLTGGDLQLVYTPSADPSRSALLYEAGGARQTFRGSEIVSTTTPAGTLVSVVLRRTVDSGATTLSVLIPRVNLGASSGSPIQTEAITTTHRFNVVQSLNVGQLDEYGFTPLEGTATHVDIPVSQPLDGALTSTGSGT